MGTSDRQAKGQSIIRELHGDGPREEIFNVIEKVFPDYMKTATEEHLYGDIWSRPQLSLRDRSMITLAAIVAFRFDLAALHDQLRAHIRFARNAGLSRDEILEVIAHVGHYTGRTATNNALQVAHALFSSE